MNTPATRMVRRAGPTDLDVLARLRYAFRAEAHPVVESESKFLSRCARWMHPRLTDASPWRAWVLEQNSEIVGNVWMQLVEKIPNPGSESEVHAYISNFFVAPSARNTGAGSLLIQTALDDARHLHVDTVILWPTARSRPLYQRLGFRESPDLLANKL
ncbi:MAG TPA: GNAT family N-acetyltransferase [Gemmatimonadaceae bacterium]|jgi:GNAT superfamily N-acetyltransferase